MGLSGPSYFINFMSLSQTVTPSHLLGRVSTLQSVVMTGTVPIGSILGGIASQAIGIRAMLVGVGCGVVLAFAVLVFSSVITLLVELSAEGRHRV